MGLLRYCLDNTECGLGRDNTGQLEPALLKQSGEFRLRALATSEGYHHLKIGQLGGMGSVARWDDVLYQQEPPLGRYCLADGSENRQRMVVVPVVDDEFQYISVATLRHRREEVAGRNVTTVDHACGPQCGASV